MSKRRYGAQMIGLLAAWLSSAAIVHGRSDADAVAPRGQGLTLR